MAEWRSTVVGSRPGGGAGGVPRLNLGGIVEVGRREHDKENAGLQLPARGKHGDGGLTPRSGPMGKTEMLADNLVIGASLNAPSLWEGFTEQISKHSSSPPQSEHGRDLSPRTASPVDNSHWSVATSQEKSMTQDRISMLEMELRQLHNLLDIQKEENRNMKAELAQVKREKEACELRLREAFDDMSRSENLEKRCKILTNQLKDEKDRCLALAAEVGRMAREQSQSPDQSPEKHWDFDDAGSACTSPDDDGDKKARCSTPMSPFLGMMRKAGAQRIEAAPRPRMQMSSRGHGSAAASSCPKAHGSDSANKVRSGCGVRTQRTWSGGTSGTTCASDEDEDVDVDEDEDEDEDGVDTASTASPNVPTLREVRGGNRGVGHGDWIIESCDEGGLAQQVRDMVRAEHRYRYRQAINVMREWRASTVTPRSACEDAAGIREEAKHAGEGDWRRDASGSRAAKGSSLDSQSRPYIQISGLETSSASAFRDSSPDMSTVSPTYTQQDSFMLQGSATPRSIFSSYIETSESTNQRSEAAALCAPASDLAALRLGQSLSPPSAAAVGYVSDIIVSGQPNSGRRFTNGNSVAGAGGQAHEEGGSICCPSISTQDTTVAEGDATMMGGVVGNDSTMFLSINGSPTPSLAVNGVLKGRSPSPKIGMGTHGAAFCQNQKLGGEDDEGLSRSRRETSPLEELESLLKRAEAADARHADRRRRSAMMISTGLVYELRDHDGSGPMDGRLVENDGGFVRGGGRGADMATAAKGSKTPRGGSGCSFLSAAPAPAVNSGQQNVDGAQAIQAFRGPVVVSPSPRCSTPDDYSPSCDSWRAGTVTPPPVTPRHTGENALLSSMPRMSRPRESAPDTPHATPLPKSPRTLTTAATPSSSTGVPAIYWSDPILGGGGGSDTSLRGSQRGPSSNSKVPTVLPTIRIAVRGPSPPPIPSDK